MSTRTGKGAGRAAGRAPRRAQRRAVEDLALLGGRPAFAEPLPVGAAVVGDRARLLERIRGVLDRRCFTDDGPLVREFEHQLARSMGVRNCVATCSGTVGLEVLARAAGLAGEVIVPAFTSAATAHALRWLGLRPVFCDVDPATHTLDPARVEERVGPRTSAILGVHLWGRTCEVEALVEIARRRHLALFFDAAHAFGCTRGGRAVGGFGDAEVLSFHATMVLSTFEGGAVTTSNDALAHRLRLMRNLGCAGSGPAAGLGINGRMNEMSAAAGLTGLETLEAHAGVNAGHHERYRRGLDGQRGLRVLRYPAEERNNYQFVVLEVDPGQAGLSRDRLVEVLRAENVLARSAYPAACHAVEPYRSEDPGAAQRLPVTERLAQRVLLLPTGPALRSQDVDQVCRLVRFAVAHAQELEERLERRAA
ncbi:MAG TPA: aminotransferase class I/II-fold pyridoxal phosphate-dependent enzyme [Candidatus Saccharimonadales bacterium]|nr:aminotransferase class I/II-fold pyridoxal phosphate-dependent enzyme [Candidatus Saccharimonadales bacterium]